MKKTPSLFQRNYSTDRLVRDEVVPGSEWVLAGEGTATLKLDGTSCLVRDGRLFKRYDRRLNKQATRRKKRGATGPWALEDFRVPPEGFEPCEAEPNQHTGHWPGWAPVGDGPNDQYHREAFEALADKTDGTYELVGPAIQGNPYCLQHHELRPHGAHRLPDSPRSYEGLREYLRDNRIEGIVWHHPDGQLVKLKRRDFGYSWP